MQYCPLESESPEQHLRVVLEQRQYWSLKDTISFKCRRDPSIMTDASSVGRESENEVERESGGESESHEGLGRDEGGGEEGNKGGQGRDLGGGDGGG